MKVMFTFGALVLSLAAISADAGTLRGVIPVAGSTSGAFGANVRTSLQLSNRTDRPASGSLVFHPAGESASPDDPTLPYSLEPFQTISYEDVVAAMGATGLGSIDLVVESGGVPAIVARAYDDQQEKGTAGTGIDLVATADALSKGDSTTLIVPYDLERFRFNLGVRTLNAGGGAHIKVFNGSGTAQVEIGPLTFGPNVFLQKPAAELLGTDLRANDSIVITVDEGDLIIYGTLTDNTTNDPAIHIGTRE